MRKGLTLLELILALIILVVIILAIYRSYSFFLHNIAFYVKRADVHMEMDYAFDNLRVHALSASRIDSDSYFPPAATTSKNSFNFTGERDYKTITPNDFSDDVHYSYFVGSAGGKSGFLLVTEDGTKTSVDTLVDGSLDPAVNFTYTDGTEPNFMTVTIEAGPENARINKTDGVRFWFQDVVK